MNGASCVIGQPEPVSRRGGSGEERHGTKYSSELFSIEQTGTWFGEDFRRFLENQ